MANFLAKLCREDSISSSASLNPIRSAICTTLRMMTGVDVSQSRWVQAVMQAAGNLKPARPRYDEAWDLECLLDYWEGQPPDDQLDLSSLLDKTLSLLMAAGIMRSSDLHRMVPATISFSASSVSFRLANPKNAKGLSQPVVVAAVPNRPRICPVASFRRYLQVVSPFRRTKVQKEAMWLGSRAPHIPILAKTIASRVLRVLEAAGVDTSRFKAHSTRSAAVRKALEMGASVDEVMFHGRWRSEKVFRAYYERAQRKDAVSAAIFS